ncbi:MAG: DNA polymerase III subunit alpha [Deltaproteobacteria bacterium]|nr:DNA polymerase III subunit alpha [Deltaproteobacteria bacterium]
MAEFVHLHVHSEYSLLDGAIRCTELAPLAKRLGMRAVALTDHANMFGALRHYRSCQAQGVGAILGCEVNVLRETGGGAEAGGALDHLVLLAESERGYRNLLRVVSAGHLQPASPAAPSVRLETIASSAEGLVVLTGCMAGVVAQQALELGEQAALEALARLRGLFPSGSLYVELQDHGLPEQPVLCRLLVELAAKLDLPVVATNDVHFAAQGDGEAQLYLGCIGSGRPIVEVRAAHHGSFEMYLKTPEQMARLFRARPEAVRASVAIAERCAGLRVKLGEPMLPTFPVPEGHDAASYLRVVAGEGLAARLSELEAAGKTPARAAFAERLERELDMIAEMQFPGYFLIVWDFIRFAKQKGIPVGPGRGSGAGSLVAYALRITELDPLEHQLLFERFLNPERVSMPDFDIDFCMDRRDEVIAYVAERYGADSVGQIATFHELRARSVIKDVARAMGLEPSEGQRLANLVPQKQPGGTCTIAEALEVEPKLADAAKTDATVAELLAQAQRLEGLTRHAGMHAAGVVISEGPLWDYVPCFRSDAQVVTQYDKNDVELAGLVKFDFLGLKTLTVIDLAERLIGARPDHGSAHPFDIDKVPLDDPKTYALLQSGETTGVFQLESAGMQQLFKDLRPTEFEHIVAAVALYRPGPLGSGMVKDFVECRHGRKRIAKMHELVDDALRPTFGVIVYQEQVMQIAQRLAGYSLGQADVLRRAMGKKNAEEMAKQRETFVAGAQRKGVSPKDAEHIFELLEFFAGYGFNKSHSAAYALLTYQTAYLKAHYPVEFLCALMTADRDKNEKVVRTIAEGRAWGVEILAPEINESKIDFTVVYEQGEPATAGQGSGAEAAAAPRRARRASGRQVDDPLRPKIRFGLGAVRGLGEATLEAMLQARAEAGPFVDLFDFAERVDARKVNRAAIEALVQCGAFDATLGARHITRAEAFASVDRALERGRTASKDRERGQTTLFGIFQQATTGPGAGEYQRVEPWDLSEILRREKQALGFYVSGHPLDRYGIELGRFDLVAVKDLGEKERWASVRVAGTVEGYRERIFKGGGKAALFELEDLSGRVTARVRERQVERLAPVLTAGEPVLLTAKVSFPGIDEGPEAEESAPREPTLWVDEAEPLSHAIRAGTRSVAIRLHAAGTGPAELQKLEEALRAHPGSCPVQLVIETEQGAEATLALGRDLRVEPGDAMLASLEKLFGSKVAVLR